MLLALYVTCHPFEAASWVSRRAVRFRHRPCLPPSPYPPLSPAAGPCLVRYRFLPHPIKHTTAGGKRQQQRTDAIDALAVGESQPQLPCCGIGGQHVSVSVGRRTGPVVDTEKRDVTDTSIRFHKINFSVWNL
jgi:hypothetical protein